MRQKYEQTSLTSREKYENSSEPNKQKSIKSIRIVDSDK